MGSSFKCLLTVTFIICFYSCNEKNASNSEIESYIVSEWIENWGDSIFISQVKSLQMCNGKLYFIDQYISEIFEMDKNFELKQMIGRKGEGPNDFIYISSMSVLDSLFYVYDSGRASVICCNRKGQFLGQYKLADYRTPPYFRFAINDSNLIISNEREKQAFLEYNMQTQVVAFWGEKIPLSDEMQYRIRNGRNILSYKDKYISVPNSFPFVEVYDKRNRQLLKKYDYSDVELIRQSILKNKNNVKSNSHYWIAFDAYVENDNLYLLLGGRDTRQEFVKNQILVLNLASNEQEQEKTLIQLPGEVYDTFCIENDTIYAFNHSDSRIEMLTKEK